jgi:hypothetical protein
MTSENGDLPWQILKAGTVITPLAVCREGNFKNYLPAAKPVTLRNSPLQFLPHFSQDIVVTMTTTTTMTIFPLLFSSQIRVYSENIVKRFSAILTPYPLKGKSLKFRKI